MLLGLILSSPDQYINKVECGVSLCVSLIFEGLLALVQYVGEAKCNNENNSLYLNKLTNFWLHICINHTYLDKYIKKKSLNFKVNVHIVKYVSIPLSE